jgi:cytochrome c oxidase subunit 3
VSLSVAFAGLFAGAVIWALLVRRLNAKPWLTQGSVGALHEGGDTLLAPATIGLVTFMAVVTSLFGLFITAYHMRMMDGMEHGDWSHFPVPPLLWGNTAVLMLGSVAMEWARATAARGELDRLPPRLMAGGLLTGAFLVGQLLAWRQVRGAEYFSPANPAIAFFYLLTAVHGLHLVGGLAVWARTLARLRTPNVKAPAVSLTVSLCAVYWHFLLIVWLVLFGLMLST